MIVVPAPPVFKLDRSTRCHGYWLPEVQYGGNRYPAMVIPHDEDWKKVESRWKEYGFDEG